MTPRTERSSRLHALAWTGVALVALGAVAPLAGVRLVGRLAAWDLRPGGALVIAGLAVYSAALIVGGRMRWAWTGGLLALAAALWAIGQARPPVADPQTALAGGGIGIHRAVDGLLAGDIGIGGGLGAIVCGTLLLILAAGLDATRDR